MEFILSTINIEYFDPSLEIYLNVPFGLKMNPFKGKSHNSDFVFSKEPTKIEILT